MRSSEISMAIHNRLTETNLRGINKILDNDQLATTFQCKICSCAYITASSALTHSFAISCSDNIHRMTHHLVNWPSRLRTTLSYTAQYYADLMHNMLKIRRFDKKHFIYDLLFSRTLTRMLWQCFAQPVALNFLNISQQVILERWSRYATYQLPNRFALRQFSVRSLLKGQWNHFSHGEFYLIYFSMFEPSAEQNFALLRWPFCVCPVMNTLFDDWSTVGSTSSISAYSEIRKHNNYFIITQQNCKFITLGAKIFNEYNKYS